MAGYAFGQVMEAILVNVGRYEHWIALGMLITGAGAWLYRRYRDRTQKGT
jgi:hypothetical protein